ncbi:MAG: VWA domain-containing protein [Leptospirillia bacterium]
MKKHMLILSVALSLTLAVAGCSNSVETHRSQGVYMLLDTSGTYTEELVKAQGILNYLLGSLEPGDSLAVARIDSGSFSEKDIVARVIFDDRPSVANEQKRRFKQEMDNFVKNVHSSSHTDITGGLLQASEWLNESGVGTKRVLIFSDLEEDLAKGHIRDFPIELGGVQVVALNVTKLRSDNVDPREYLDRLSSWQSRVVSGGGSWSVINDLERLERIFAKPA